MSHHDFKAKVDEEFNRRVQEGDISASERLTLRNKVAKELLLLEDEATRERLRLENDKAHEDILSAQEAAAQGNFQLDDDAKDA